MWAYSWPHSVPYRLTLCLLSSALHLKLLCHQAALSCVLQFLICCNLPFTEVLPGYNAHIVREKFNVSLTLQLMVCPFLGPRMRGMHLLPRRGDKPEWQHTQDYWNEKDELPAIDLDDRAFVYA